MGISNQEFYNGTQNGSPSYNGTPYNNEFPIFDCYVLPIFNILVCIFGILGNGMVIWLLGFHIKRTQFTTYILNLVIADFLLLTVSEMYIAFVPEGPEAVWSSFTESFLCFFSTSQCFLAVISMDKCASVFFPQWYHSHQPKHLSTIIGALIWAFSLSSTAIVLILYNTIALKVGILIKLIITSLLCFLLITISGLMLFLKVCCKPKEQRRRILITILIIVFFFLFLCLPVNVMTMISLNHGKKSMLIYYAVFCACLYSSVNPLIYYLVGRSKDGRSKESMKVALQELFKEEET